MALSALARGASQLAKKYSPQIVSNAKTMLSRATDGGAAVLEELPKYVGKNANRMKIAGNALVRAGIDPADVYPDDIVGANQQLLALRQEAEELANTLRSKFDAGADHSLDDRSIPAVVISLKRTKAALDVYGSEERYFLVNPNGGIPASEFALRRAIRQVI